MGESHHSLWSSSGYQVNNPSAWGPPIPSAMAPIPTAPPPRFDLRHTSKRALSESDDNDDNAFSEESSKDRCSSPNDDCQMGFSRKKRRGIIEKRRRDRINTSLSELRRLVPSAFEKQGSAKLEKAEILQLTVDHLKTVHSKGLDALSYDPHKVAMDYHSIGFRECAAEVARYLVTVEGMDIQDPLRLRLMSHLQCFAAQRELATKQPSTPWNYNSYPPIHEYPATSYELPNSTQHQQPLSSHLGHPLPPMAAPAPHHQSLPSGSRPHSDRRHPSIPPEHHQTDALSPPRHDESPRAPQPAYQNQPSYPSSFQQNSYNSSGEVKPYRPWGAEVAY